jgi:CHAT domain-containing protein/tetratricopeptide (TPR) repeat protein
MSRRVSPLSVLSVLSLLIAIGFLLLSRILPPQGPESASIVEATNRSLEEVAQLRASGAYLDARVKADSLLGAVGQARDLPVWTIVEVRRQAETLRRILKLSPPAQAEMADAEILWSQAAAFYQEDAIGPALQLLRKALSIRERHLGASDPEVADLKVFLASMLEETAQMQESERLLLEALPVLEASLGPIHPSIDSAYDVFGNLKVSLGQAREAEKYFSKSAEQTARIWGTESWEWGTVNQSLGNVQVELGEYAQAEGHFLEAEKIRRNLESWDDLAQTLISLGATCYYKHEEACAEKYYQEAASVAAKHELSPVLHRQLLNSLAALRFDLRRYAEAESLFRRALDLWGQALGSNEFHPSMALVHVNLGASLAGQGRFHAADSEVRKGLDIYRRIYPPANLNVLWAEKSLADCWWLAGDYLRAADKLVEVVALAEPLRHELGGLGLKVDWQIPYNELAACQLKLHRGELAWSTQERHQGRLVLDAFLRSESTALTAEEKSERSRLIDARKTASRTLDALKGRAEAPATAAEIDTATARLQKAELAVVEFWGRMDLRYPVSMGLPYSRQEVQRTLAADEAIVGWVQVDAGKPSAAAWGYVLRATGPPLWVAQPGQTGRDSTSSTVTLLQAIRGAKPWTEAANQVFDDRFANLMPALRSCRALIVVPSGDLLGIPAEILPTPDGQPLGERFIVSYAPSATVFAWLRERGQQMPIPPRILALGDPPFNQEQARQMTVRAEGCSDQPGVGGGDITAALRGVQRGRGDSVGGLPRLCRSRDEVLALVHLGSSQSRGLTGLEASEDQLLRLLRTGELYSYDILHFATHALVDPEDHHRSVLVLSLTAPPNSGARGEGEEAIDGFVSVEEILGEWDLNAKLVTLSGCETGLGRKLSGEGYLGLTTAMLQVGAGSVLCSLWPVGDEAAAIFMRAFYGALLNPAAPQSKREALQAAKIALREYRDPQEGLVRFRHPFYWAGFVLLGNPD